MLVPQISIYSAAEAIQYLHWYFDTLTVELNICLSDCCISVAVYIMTHY